MNYNMRRRVGTLVLVGTLGFGLSACNTDADTAGGSSAATSSTSKDQAPDDPSHYTQKSKFKNDDEARAGLKKVTVVKSGEPVSVIKGKDRYYGVTISNGTVSTWRETSGAWETAGMVDYHPAAGTTSKTSADFVEGSAKPVFVVDLYRGSKRLSSTVYAPNGDGAYAGVVQDANGEPSTKTSVEASPFIRAEVVGSPGTLILTTDRGPSKGGAYYFANGKLTKRVED